MKRAENVKKKAKQIISDGNKPSAIRIAEETGYAIHDVHRCLNHLEKNNEVQTYTKQIFGQKHRMIGVKR